MDNPLFLFGILFFLAAQVLRAIKWQFLMPGSYNKNHLLLYLSIGSLLNILLPLKIGELIRAYLVSSKYEINYIQSLTSIIYEKITDIIVILVMLIFIRLVFFYEVQISNLLLIILFFLIALKILLNNLFLRRLVGSALLIIPEKISFYIKHMLWNYVSFGLKNIVNYRYIFYTILMWILYFASYYLFFVTSNIGSFNTVISIFHDNFFYGNILRPYNIEILSENYKLFLIFLLFPIFTTIFYSLLKLTSTKFSLINSFIHTLSSSLQYKQYKKTTFFPDYKEYLIFLNNFFSSKKNYLDNFSNLNFLSYSVLKIFRGGSGAITTLININESFFVRKVQKLSLNSNLSTQYLWMHSCKFYPVAKVLNFNKYKNQYEFYDMPYDLYNSDMSNWVRNTRDTDLFEMMKNILDHIKINIQSDTHKIKKNYLINFYDTKILDNFKIIEEQFPDIFKSGNLVINRKKISLKSLLNFKNKEFFLKQVDNIGTQKFHGDFTLENIIISKNNWFLIDPNPNQIFKSRYIDFSKIFQSLNSGYEELSSIQKFKFNNNLVSYKFNKSIKYCLLFNYVKRYILKEFDNDFLRQVYLHEIFHFIRLLRYKIIYDKDRSIIYLAQLILLANAFHKKYIN